MKKKINFVFDWIGPQHPIPNNTVPNIFDLANASGRANINRTDSELKAELQTSVCYEFFKKIGFAKAYASCDLPDDVFLYEYNHYWWHNVEEFFGSGKLGGMLGWGQMPENVFNRIRERTAYLLVTIPMESPLRDNELAQIENYFRNSGLPLSQIIYLTCSPNCQELYDDYCVRHNKPNEGLQFEYLPFYFYIYKDLTANKQTEYTIGKKEKTFLMFNRRWGSQVQRVLMLAYLHKNNLIEHFHISFPKIEIDNGGTYTDHARQFFSRLTTENIITDSDLEQIENRLPLILDTPNHKLNLMFDEFESTKQFYDSSFVHLIAETNFFTKIIHLTEKSYKPIAYKQPFIMFAAKGSLKALQEQGFNTFGNLWNEDYDDETDDTARFFKILDLIKEIAAWSDEKKRLVSMFVKNIVDHNYHVLQTTATPLVISFREKYGI